MANVRVQYAFPAAALFDHVAVYIELEVAGGVAQDLVPPDMTSLQVTLSGRWSEGLDLNALSGASDRAMLFGTTSHARWLRGQDGIAFCVGLHPLAWPTLLGQKADQYINRATALRDIWGTDANAFFPGLQRCVDFEARTVFTNDFLIGRLRNTKKSAAAQDIMTIRQALADPACADVASLAKRVGMAHVRLGRLTKAHFGFSPKMLIRRERFRRMLHRIDAHSYANWPNFLDPQYVDQSHMIRDFQDFLGLSPGQYMALDRPFVAAAFAEFRRMMGSPPADGS